MISLRLLYSGLARTTLAAYFGFAGALILSAEDLEFYSTPPVFYASYDRGIDAEQALSFPSAGGFGVSLIADGARGGAVLLVERGGHLHYRGQSNINTERGTMLLKTRGTAVAGEEGPAWLWQARCERYVLGVLSHEEGLALIVEHIDGSEIARLDLPEEQRSSEQWYDVTASWDASTQQAWLGLDSNFVEGSFLMPRHPGAAWAFYIGGASQGRYYTGGMLEAGNAFDELIIYDLPWPDLARGPAINPDERATSREVEAGVRRNLETIAGLQNYGGWMRSYTWPTLIGTYAQGRGFIEMRNVVTLDKSDGSARTGSHFLQAYDILKDPVFLDIAQKTGDFLVSAQSPGGYWYMNYELTPSGFQPTVPTASGGGRPQVKFQDGVQSDALAFLISLYLLSGEERYRVAALANGDFYLASQNPDGSWSHHYHPELGVGRSANGLHHHAGEINDRTMNDGIDVMVLLWHFNKDPRYLEAAKRAGDWLVAAQLGGEVRGWAEQYDSDLNPIRARRHEPAAFSRTATMDASEALIEIYRLSGEDRYLEPIRKTAEWLKERFPEGTMYAYYDLESGRPIAAWQHEIYYLDDPADLEKVLRFPLNPNIRFKQPVPDLEGLLAQAEINRVDEDVPMEELRSRALWALNSQNEAGVWVQENIGGGPHTLGSGFNPYRARLIMMLNYLAATQKQAGTFSGRLGGDGDLFKMSVTEDWYDVDWPSE